MRKVIFILIMLIVFSAAASIAFGKTGNTKQEIYYEVVMIKKGDTLWNLAESFRPQDMSVAEYVEYIMKFNDMKNDKIISGQNIILPVFCWDKKWFSGILNLKGLTFIKRKSFFTHKNC